MSRLMEAKEVQDVTQDTDMGEFLEEQVSTDIAGDSLENSSDG